MKLIGPEGYSVLDGVNIFSSIERSLFFHGSTKGGTSLEGVIFLFPKLKLENVNNYNICVAKIRKNTNFVPWNCIFPWKTGRVSSVENNFFAGSGIHVPWNHGNRST